MPHSFNNCHRNDWITEMWHHSWQFANRGSEWSEILVTFKARVHLNENILIQHKKLIKDRTKQKCAVSVYVFQWFLSCVCLLLCFSYFLFKHFEHCKRSFIPLHCVHNVGCIRTSANKTESARLHKSRVKICGIKNRINVCILYYTGCNLQISCYFVQPPNTRQY